MEQYKIGGEPENSDTVYNEVVYNVGNHRILTPFFIKIVNTLSCLIIFHFLRYLFFSGRFPQHL